MDLSSLRLSGVPWEIHRGMEGIPATGTGMTHAGLDWPGLSFASNAPGSERTTRTGSSVLRSPPGFTTENTENHGVARRFFKRRRRASTLVLGSNTRPRKYFLKMKSVETAPRQSVARSFRHHRRPRDQGRSHSSRGCVQQFESGRVASRTARTLRV